MQVRSLSIIGVGLLGGSIGLAVRSTSKPYTITGYGHNVTTLDRALESEAIDRKATDWRQAVGQADLVILCTPVGLFQQMFRKMAPHLKPGTIVTDVGSTKRSVVRLAEKILPKHVRFVGSHPMAGSEKRGVEFARADLFQGAVCITTPTERTDGDALAKVEAFWQMIGMRVVRLTPGDHDRLLADISHLPHAVAASLVSMQVEDALDLAGKGFLDTTRVAGGDGALWRDILMDNRDNLRASLARLRERLSELEGMLQDQDDEKLAAWLTAASTRRQKLLERKLKELNPD